MAEPGNQPGIGFIRLGTPQARLSKRLDLRRINDANPVSGIDQELGNRFPLTQNLFLIEACS